MLFVQIINGKAVKAQTEFPEDRTNFQNRHDWKTFERAMIVAQRLNDNSSIPTPYLAIDNGGNVSPRYDVIERPQIGDKVSYAFNGDYYPDGKIVNISASLRIVTTDTGSKYYRRGQTGRWVKSGGTWSLVQGHRNDKNPSF